ncbi:hypothetical protein [Paraburkholderia gardini]|uniref:hypothetical protein n=1 Tax=Paraburkholderia gardini TaxID=2823469 RepID=UPI001E5F8D40|nr:hypothetical protein [Paraburkholderia gardini]
MTIADSGMNVVINLPGYSEAARINPIPIGASILMSLLAVSGCVAQGYRTKSRCVQRTVTRHAYWIQ